MAEKLLLVPIILVSALTLVLALALLTGHDAQAVNLLNTVRQSRLVAALANPFSLLDQRSPGGRSGPLQQTKPPHERVLAQVRDREPPADAPADAPATDLTGGGPGFAVGPGSLPPDASSSPGSSSPSGGQPAPAAFGARAPSTGSLFGAPAGSPGSGGNGGDSGTGGSGGTDGSNPPSGDQTSNNPPPPGGDGTPPITNFDAPPGDTNPVNLFTPPPGLDDNPGPPGGDTPTTPGGDTPTTPGGDTPIVSVPEPASWTLLIGGIMVVVGARRRRRRKRQ